MFLVANDIPLDPNRPNVVIPVMYDDDAEREQVISVFQRYNKERMSPAVNDAFEALATARRHRSPLRHFIGLPLRRLWAEWHPLPEYELPMRTPLLGLPKLRKLFGGFEWLLFALAIGGAWRLRKREPKLVLLVLTVVAARSLVPALSHPFPVERYLVEAFPALLILTGYALSELQNYLATRRLARATLRSTSVAPS
jgi:hypothetical protein